MTEARRQNPITPPFGGNVGQTPWASLGMSRSNWYRHGKPTKRPYKRMTDVEVAREAQVSLRRVQRNNRIGRECPQLKPFFRLGILKSGTAERCLGNPDRLAVLICDLLEIAKQRGLTVEPKFENERLAL
jgi:hypothetical protein